MTIRIRDIDHVVLRVSDVARAVTFLWGVRGRPVGRGQSAYSRARCGRRIREGVHSGAGCIGGDEIKRGGVFQALLVALGLLVTAPCDDGGSGDNHEQRQADGIFAVFTPERELTIALQVLFDFLNEVIHASKLPSD